MQNHFKVHDTNTTSVVPCVCVCVHTRACRGVSVCYSFTPFLSAICDFKQGLRLTEPNSANIYFIFIRA